MRQQSECQEDDKETSQQVPLPQNDSEEPQLVALGFRVWGFVFRGLGFEDFGGFRLELGFQCFRLK